MNEKLDQLMNEQKFINNSVFIQQPADSTNENDMYGNSFPLDSSSKLEEFENKLENKSFFKQNVNILLYIHVYYYYFYYLFLIYKVTTYFH